MNPEPTPTPPPARDPLPRMFIVCTVIAGVLLLIIFSAILADFVARGQEANEPPPFTLFDAPPGTVEGNPIRVD